MFITIQRLFRGYSEAIFICLLFLAGCGDNKEQQEKNKELEQKIAELEERLGLPAKYSEEWRQAIKECKELAEDPNSDPQKSAAAKKKLEDLQDRLEKEDIFLTSGMMVSFVDTDCVYGDRDRDRYIAPNSPAARSEPNIIHKGSTEEVEDWNAGW